MMTRRQEQPEEDATVWSVRHNPYSYRTLSDVGDLGVVKDLTGLLNHVRGDRDRRDVPLDELSCKLWVHRRGPCPQMDTVAPLAAQVLTTCSMA